MKQVWALVVESKPLYAAAMVVQLQKSGFHHVEIVSNQAEAERFLVNQPPSLMLVNVELISNPPLIAGFPYIGYLLHNGSQLNRIQPDWQKGELLDFPCSVERFQQALETAMILQG